GIDVTDDLPARREDALGLEAGHLGVAVDPGGQGARRRRRSGGTGEGGCGHGRLSRLDLYNHVILAQKFIWAYRLAPDPVLPLHLWPDACTASAGGGMSRVLEKSHAHYRRALTRMPLGVASNFRFWGEDRTIYVKYGRGGRIFDLDDNEYIDYRLGYGPAILGHADPRVDEAAREGIKIGGVFALATEREYSVAQRIAKMVPAAELVRFSNSGTEA